MWLEPLKKVLQENTQAWEVYRGDSFQLEVTPPDSLKLALLIKATLRSIQGLDARMAIGIGEKLFQAAEVGHSTGDAFVFSGESFEALKKEKQSLLIKSYWEDFDNELNMMLKLVLLITDSWSVASAEIAALVIQNPEITQQELAKKLNLRQSSVSERYNRAQLHEILDLIQYYKKRYRRQTLYQ